MLPILSNINNLLKILKNFQTHTTMNRQHQQSFEDDYRDMNELYYEISNSSCYS